MSAKLVELIEAEEHIGRGKPEDPYRIIKRWYTKEGQLVSEKDDWHPENSARFRQVSILVLPDGAFRIEGSEGEWEPGYTYKFWHPMQEGAR